VCSYGFGSIQISSQEILIFGGCKKNSFILETSDFQVVPKDSKPRPAKILTLKGSPLCVEGFFGYDSDYICRGFGNFLYAVDAHSFNLHVFSVKDKLWNFSSLTDLGVNF